MGHPQASVLTVILLARSLERRSSVGWTLLFATGLVVAMATPARAQYASHGSSSADDSCRMCHDSHTDTGGAYGLNLSGKGVLESLGTDLGDVSIVCLRCHSGLLSDVGSPAVGATPLIGPSLADDHVLGRVLSRDLLPSWQTAVAAPTALGEGDRNRVECNTCHDPHDVTSNSGFNPIGQRQLCARCHEDVEFESMSHRQTACSSCHELHGGVGQPLSYLSQARTCGACHLPDQLQLQSEYSNAPPPDYSVLAPPDATHLGGLGQTLCSECHQVH